MIDLSFPQNVETPLTAEIVRPLYIMRQLEMVQVGWWVLFKVGV